MKLLHRNVLKSLPGPFLAAFGTLMFLLLMQFLINYLPELVGRGLPLRAIVELIAYSLAYMVVLAVPMSVLLATLLAFGRLAESRAYAVAKAAGVSLLRLAWPVLVLGAIVAGGMMYFNNVTLPEANHRMKALWRDIREKKPGFELEPGVFYDGIDGYAIRVGDAPAESNRLREVLIFDHTENGERATITAEHGALETLPGGAAVRLTLYSGEIHRLSRVRDPEHGRAERYERVGFDRHRLRLDLSDLSFERRDAEGTSRSDRTMRTSQMVQIVDSLETGVAHRLADLRAALERLGDYGPERVKPDSTWRGDAAAPRAILSGFPEAAQAAAYDVAVQRMRLVRSEADAVGNAVQWERQRADRYRVEIYKKYSMAVACVIFVLVGIPLGLSIRRGGLGLAATLAVFIFLFYWVTLVQGEKLADRGLLEPWVGMWAANVLVGCLGLFLLLRETRDPAGRDPLGWLIGRFGRVK